MFRTAATPFLGLALIGCSAPTRFDEQRIDPLTVAEEYTRKHYPESVPEGLERAWLVEDHGDIWTVEMFKQGTFGGGVKVGISKRDGRVLGAQLGQ